MLLTVNPFDVLDSNMDIAPRVKEKTKLPKYDFLIEGKTSYQLRDLVEANYCLHDLVDKCGNRTPPCKKKHLPHHGNLYRFLKDILMDLPKYLPSLKEDLKEFESDFKLPMSYGICLYASRGIPCINQLHQRFFHHQDTFICHTDVSKARKKIAAGFHYDIVFNVLPPKLISIEPLVPKEYREKVVRQELVAKAKAEAKSSKSLEEKYEFLMRKNHLENLETYSTEELEILQFYLLLKNKEILRENAELNYQNGIISIPLPRVYDPTKYPHEIQLIEDLYQEFDYSD